MAQKLNILAVFVFLLLISSITEGHDQPCVFDVTSEAYGAKPGSDITKALDKAWKDACASKIASKVLVPSGTYSLREETFTGPCNAPIELEVQGTLQAPEDANNLKSNTTWVGFRYIGKLTISGGGTFDGHGALAWSQNDCSTNKHCKSIVNLRFDFINDTIVQDITSLNSKNFHMTVFACNNVTFQRLNISAPKESINTDGIHVGRSLGINITDTVIGTGDDCVSIGDGNSQIFITNVTCGPGHGISIGSLGKYVNELPVSGIRVNNCTLSNTDNGVRIKTWPASPSASSVSDIHFEDIIMNNVSNPVLIDQEYCPYNLCDLRVPSKVKISNVGFVNIKGSSATELAIKIDCSRDVPCENVDLNGIDLSFSGVGRVTSQCSHVKSSKMSGLIRDLACAASALKPPLL